MEEFKLTHQSIVKRRYHEANKQIEEHDKLFSLKQIRKLFELAIEYDSYLVVEFLLKRSIHRYDIDNISFNSAWKSGSVRVVELLLIDRRIDPSADNNDAIRLASYNGHTEIVRLLLADSRVDPRYDNYAIRFASENGHAEVVKLLADRELMDKTKKSMIVT